MVAKKRSTQHGLKEDWAWAGRRDSSHEGEKSKTLGKSNELSPSNTSGKTGRMESVIYLRTRKSKKDIPACLIYIPTSGRGAGLLKVILS